MQNMKEIAIKKLNERGVTVRDIADITYDLQKNYYDVTIEECEEMVNYIIDKREAVHTILTGIALDEMAEKDLIDSDINDVIKNDYKLYGIDEILGLSIVNMNGSIALTNFGYVDKLKPGIIGKLDKEGKENNDVCHTFLDDIVGAIAASAASRLAHSREQK